MTQLASAIASMVDVPGAIERKEVNLGRTRLSYLRSRWLMMMSSGRSAKMNPETYLDLIKDGKTDEARRYKSSIVPKTLYKYYFLFDERYINHEVENKIRLETLENNQLWLSSVDNFNDPFEFKAMFLDEQTIQERGWNVD